MSRGSKRNVLITKKRLLLTALLAVAVTGGYLGYACFTYDLPLQTVTHKIARHAVLTAIDLATDVYDPSVTVKPAFGPDGRVAETHRDQYVRAETYFAKAKHDGIALERIENKHIIRSRFPFSYQPYPEPRLKELREKYQLDKVVDGAKDELERFVLLRNWARSQFRRNDFQDMITNFDALEILSRNQRNPENLPRRGDQYTPCHFFPLFYAQVMLSMGYQVRVCQISFDGYNGHGLTEVWSNQFEKWIIMDADLNLHYEKDGLPLNLLEMHQVRYEENPLITIVRGRQTSGDREGEKKIDLANMINYHSYFKIADMRNDWMTNHYFNGHPKRSDKASLYWVDENMPKLYHFTPTTSKHDDFYWSLNQTEIWIDKNASTREGLNLLFKTYTPNFDHFEITINKSKKIVLKDNLFFWKIIPGENNLSVCAVNIPNGRGPESKVSLRRE